MISKKTAISKSNSNFICYINVRRIISGYSLLEILIALFILSFGLLSLLSAASMALRRTHDIYLMSLAEIAAANLLEAAQSGGIDNYYDDQWRTNLMNILPNGESSFYKSKISNGYQSSVCWTTRFGQSQNKQQCVVLESSN